MKNKEKEIKAYCYRKLSVHKWRQEEEKNKETITHLKKINKMTLVSSNLSTITLKVSGLSSPIKMYKVGDGLRVSHMLPTTDSFQL